MIKRNFEPDYESALSAIRGMSDEGLKELINDDDKVDEIVKVCEQCKFVETEKELIMAQNKSLAEYNLSLSPGLESRKTKLKELCESVQALRDAVEEKQSELRNHSGNLSSDTVLALLQAGAAESEEESEKIAEKFYQKDLEIEEFLDQFQTFRKLMHLRKVKADKMNEIINKKQKGGTTPGKVPNVPYPTPSSVPYPNPAVPYPISSVPYPVGGMGMPHIPKYRTNEFSY